MVRRIQRENSAQAGNLSFPDNRHITELKTRDLLVAIKALENTGFNEGALRLQQRTSAIMRYAVLQGTLGYNLAQEMSGAITTGKRAHRSALPFERYHEF
ncbi:MAG: hypothetical protein XXXJIFNMEKO3_01688 [Candidatus Erwinia impunctatus]|nr:hypothetical protein XXXJIFNMEKO_01688 [Culicoides impunctatus]